LSGYKYSDDRPDICKYSLTSQQLLVVVKGRKDGGQMSTESEKERLVALLEQETTSVEKGIP